MSYLDFKKDLESMDFFEFINKWDNHSKYDEYNQKKFDEDFYEYVCETYNYDRKKIRNWKIFKNTCEIYVKCLNHNDLIKK